MNEAMTGAHPYRRHLWRIALAIVIACLALPLQMARASETRAALSGQNNAALFILCSNDDSGASHADNPAMDCDHCLTCGGATPLASPEPDLAGTALPAFVLLQAVDAFVVASDATEKPLRGGGSSWSSRAPPLTQL
jgi:hypothetical protein